MNDEIKGDIHEDFSFQKDLILTLDHILRSK